MAHKRLQSPLSHRPDPQKRNPKYCGNYTEPFISQKSISLWRVEQHQTIHVYTTGHSRKAGKSEDWDVSLYVSSKSSNTLMGKSWLSLVPFIYFFIKFLLPFCFLLPCFAFLFRSILNQVQTEGLKFWIQLCNKAVICPFLPNKAFLVTWKGSVLIYIFSSTLKLAVPTSKKKYF